MKKLGYAAALSRGIAAAVAAAQATDYRAVTDQRLANPEPENWLSWRGNYPGWGYSPLDQIKVDNVQDLVPVWSYSTGVNEGHQAPPIVNDGMMYVTTPENQIIALDAATGTDCGATSGNPAGGPVPASSHQPRRRALWRQGLHGDAGRLRRGTRGGRRRRGLGNLRRRLRRRLLHDPLAAGGEGQGRRRSLGRRVRRSRLHRRPSMPRPARRPGRPTPSRAPASRAMTPGRVRPGRPAARRCGCRATTTPRAASPSSAPATAAHGCRTRGRATTSIPARRRDRRRDRRAQGVPPVPLERRLGLGRGVRRRS